MSACNAGDLGLIPGLGRFPGEGNGNPLQYSCLENPMDGEAWWAIVHRVAKSRTQLSNLTNLNHVEKGYSYQPLTVMLAFVIAYIFPCIEIFFLPCGFRLFSSMSFHFPLLGCFEHFLQGRLVTSSLSFC